MWLPRWHVIKIAVAFDRNSIHNANLRSSWGWLRRIFTLMISHSPNPIKGTIRFAKIYLLSWERILVRKIWLQGYKIEMSLRQRMPRLRFWYHGPVLKTRKNIYSSHVQVTFELYGHFRWLQVFIRNKATLIKYCLTEFESFEILLVRQYLVNCTEIANATVFKTESIFTGLGHGQVSQF